MCPGQSLVRKSSSPHGRGSGASHELNLTSQREEIFPKLAAMFIDRQDTHPEVRSSDEPPLFLSST